MISRSCGSRDMCQLYNAAALVAARTVRPGHPPIALRVGKAGDSCLPYSVRLNWKGMGAPPTSVHSSTTDDHPSAPRTAAQILEEELELGLAALGQHLHRAVASGCAPTPPAPTVSPRRWSWRDSPPPARVRGPRRAGDGRAIALPCSRVPTSERTFGDGEAHQAVRHDRQLLEAREHAALRIEDLRLRQHGVFDRAVHRGTGGHGSRRSSPPSRTRR